MNPARPIFYAVFKSAEEGGYCVFFPDVPGALTQGETIGEALKKAYPDLPGAEGVETLAGALYQ